MSWRVTEGRRMMVNGVMYESGKILPAEYKPDNAHKENGDIIYCSASNEKLEDMKNDRLKNDEVQPIAAEAIEVIQSKKKPGRPPAEK